MTPLVEIPSAAAVIMVDELHVYTGSEAMAVVGRNAVGTASALDVKTLPPAAQPEAAGTPSFHCMVTIFPTRANLSTAPGTVRGPENDVVE